MIRVEDVSIRFHMDMNRTSRLKEWVVSFLSGKQRYQDFWALRDISFEVKRGEVFGIVGRNGSGKSTLLKVVSGIYKPRTGKSTVYGSIAPMLELGSGFDMELTGRENIFLNGAILGFSERFLREKYEEIVEFSELEKFIDAPIKTYSSGMLARLAFSVATIVHPEVLIVDEILSVGDEQFQQKSLERMMTLMHGGTTVLFVSHSLDQVRELCGRVLWLDEGRIRMIGDAQTVCDAYKEETLAEFGEEEEEEEDEERAYGRRHSARDRASLTKNPKDFSSHTATKAKRAAPR